MGRGPEQDPWRTLGRALELLEVAVPLLDVVRKDTVFGRCTPIDVIKTIAGVPRDDDERPLSAVTISMIAIDTR